MLCLTTPACADQRGDCGTIVLPTELVVRGSCGCVEDVEPRPALADVTILKSEVG